VETEVSDIGGVMTNSKPLKIEPSSKDWSKLSYSPKPYLAIHFQQESQTYTWVKLLQLPGPFSFDEALLLCPLSIDQWLVWIPDYGETLIHTSNFSSI
jgi:hypothetical protein